MTFYNASRLQGAERGNRPFQTSKKFCFVLNVFSLYLCDKVLAVWKKAGHYN